jgi:mercuric ion transport protein
MIRERLEKMGTVGALVAALACPICFPKLALIGGLLGLGFLAPYEEYIAYGVQALFVVALAGHLYAYRRHGRRYVPVLAALATAMLFIGFWAFGSTILMLAAIALLAFASVLQVVESRRCATCEAT